MDKRTREILIGCRASTKIDTWELLWRTLFPEDHEDNIPDPSEYCNLEFPSARRELFLTRRSFCTSS